MSKKHFSLTTIGLSVMLGLSACGGSSDSTPTTTSAAAASGPITAFGSIYVNGKRYDTSNATVYIEDKVASEADLKVGMMVNVYESSNGVASSVYFDDELEGIVNSNNIVSPATTGTMVVMGQTVTVDEYTIFESDVIPADTFTTFSDIAQGNIVEVSGYVTGSGTITATRIEVKATDLASYLSEYGSDIEIKGVISNLDESAMTFSLGNLVVAYAGADMSDIPTGGLIDGLYVEVYSTEGLNANDQLIASKVEVEDDGDSDYDGDEDDEYEVKGKVVEVTETSVTVNKDTFLITDETEFDDGTINDLVVGAMVEIEGYMNDGQLVAEEIEFEDTEATTEFEDTVASIQLDDTNIGTITLTGGEEILINNDTLMKDDMDDGMIPDPTFNLSELNVGDYVEVIAYDNGDGTYTATKLEREDTP